MAVDYSKLPRDLLGLALSKLSTSDYARFGAVCRTWRQAFLERDHPPAPQTPWLILPGHDKRTLNFLSLSESNKVYEIQQPDPMIHRRLYIGSSDGWLFTITDTILDMHLLNPITGVQILLPSITTFSFVEIVCDSKGCVSKYVISEEGEDPYDQSPDNARYTFFKKAVLFKTARDMKDGFIVMLIHLPTNKLAFTRTGDDTWTTLNGRQGLQDVIRRKGQIYTVSYEGVVDLWEPDGQSFKPRTIAGDPDGQSFKPRTITGELNPPGYHEYLVESLTGDLLWVRRSEEWYGVFKVLTLDESTSKWVEINDLGDQALFVGHNRSIALSVREHPELKKSCIYFTDDILWLYYFLRHDYRDMGVYNLADDNIERFNFLPTYRNWPPSIWFTPSL